MTDRRQVHLHQAWQAVKPIIHGRDIAPKDQADDASVVELVAPFCHTRRVVAEGMIGSAHAKARERTGEETPKDEPVRSRGGGVPGCDVGLEEEIGKEP